ncbi:Holliday junction branch migration protein RuvA [Caldinitratiruptor microaerophilus]|uniref:Holliday junction branch migration complex subunit RuvA n=1 Tax=Caldinitratiruptor microaerophilus TaxID=671077 RepID=A0AA35CNG1_9FIRM|nr:Holliday junction branch migration protein RuvA [Caldinitratiruptor microaerophilus]BDG60807.1 Holliday junction ATP-dependent DNA helicase RuvA [Caldinitratiruptor microaerophilus]
MIAHLQGRLVRAGADHVVVDVAGVGYRVLVPASTRERLPGAGREVLLYTSLQVREDSLTLFGFLTQGELELFEALLTVSGIGPKVALAILSAASPDEVRRAIVLEDTAFLTRLPQVGRKLAQRLVLELRERLSGSARPAADGGPGPAAPAHPAAQAWADAAEALAALGYPRPEALRALEAIRPQAGDGAEAAALVRLALRWLGGGAASGEL